MVYQIYVATLIIDLFLLLVPTWNGLIWVNSSLFLLHHFFSVLLWSDHHC